METVKQNHTTLYLPSQALIRNTFFHHKGDKEHEEREEEIPFFTTEAQRTQRRKRTL